MHNVCPEDLLGFRLELVLCCEKQSEIHEGSAVQKETWCNAQGYRLCELERVAQIGLKSGRCRHCQLMKRTSVHSTSFGCTVCVVRL